MRALAKLLKTLFILLLGGASVAVAAAVLFLNSRPPLEPWHIIDLDREFSSDLGLTSFEDYLTQENLVFNELEKKLISGITPKSRDKINRFQPESISNPQSWPQNWNRTFILTQKDPKASVLLLHGMSDSPYSLRNLGKTLHDSGAAVIGLRLPGHGTAPAGLTKITWQDMSAAVQLAVRHLYREAPDKPIHLVGYSNGAALAVLYALQQLDTTSLPPIDRIVIISPAIGVTPAAAYAIWQARLGEFLGLEQLAWNTILPEYDPYKYGSFAVNAGTVTHQLTREIQQRITNIKAFGKWQGFPPVLGFSSAVDATVSTSDMITQLFNRLPKNGSELMLFDVNQKLAKTPLVSFDPNTIIDPLSLQPDKPFTLSVVTNLSPTSAETVLRTYRPDSEVPDQKDLGLSWPDRIYSLAHISLPFSKDDPLYGIVPDHEQSQLQLGDIVLRGERGILQVPASDLIRQRWNPFYPVLEDRALGFLQLEPEQGG